MLQYLNWRVKITLSDTRYLVGTFMAFDKHMNIVLADTEEFRIITSKTSNGANTKPEKREEKRVLGFILLRGENVISMTPETPPPPKNKMAAAGGLPGAGIGRAVPMGRGLPPPAVAGAPQGLVGPIRGMGGPVPQVMMPVGVAPAMLPPAGRGVLPQPPMMMGAPMGRGIPQPMRMPNAGFPAAPGGVPLPPPPGSNLPFGRGFAGAGAPPGFGGRGMPPPPPPQ